MLGGSLLSKAPKIAQEMSENEQKWLELDLNEAD